MSTWTLATLNCNGLRSAVRRGFTDWYRRADPDVLCMQELRMQAADMDLAHQPPEGFASVQSDAEKKGYSGTAVWSRLHPLHTATGCGLDWADLEGRVSMMQLREALVVSVYLPSGSSGEARQAMKEAFMGHFADWAGGLLASGAPVVICGDLNIAHQEIDIHDPKGNAKNSGFLPHERAWFTRLLEQGWVDVFRRRNPTERTYSWWSNRGQARANNKGWRLDYQLASPVLAERAEACWIDTGAGLSDHAPVLARYRR